MQLENCIHVATIPDDIQKTQKWRSLASTFTIYKKRMPKAQSNRDSYALILLQNGVNCASANRLTITVQ